MVELTVTDDSNNIIFQQQTYKVQHVRRLKGLCNVVRVQSRSKFEENCGANKELSILSRVLERKEKGIPGENITRLPVDGRTACDKYAEWMKSNVRAGEPHSTIAMRLKAAEKR